MKIRIYQINSERDKDRLRFMNSDFLFRKVGEVKPVSSTYDLIYEGKVDCKGLEDVYRMFNRDRPVEFMGHSLSVSDVVEVVDGSNVRPGFYFCDTISFREVPFEPDKAQTPADRRTISVVLVEPGKKARPAHIDGSLAGMQQIVGGYIQAVYPYEDEACIVCNEESKLDGLPLNRALRDESGEIYDIIAGTFFICGCGGENFSSLTEEQRRRYTEMFKCPERFLKINGQIMSIPVRERKGGEQER